MFWQETTKEEVFIPPDTIQDLAFNIHSKILPMDHAYPLAQAVLQHLPWLEEVGGGIFDISVSDGNGWEQNKDGFYYPSRRSKLILRLPKTHLDQALTLVGQTLSLGDYEVAVVKALKPKLLSDMPVVFAKGVVCESDMSENDFLQQCYQELQDLGIQVKKMLAGLDTTLQTDQGLVHAKSLMIADLGKAESVHIQEVGLGPFRTLGCGLFLPHKDIETL